MNRTTLKTESPFQPPVNVPGFLPLFAWQIKWMFRFYFKRVWLCCSYTPEPTSRTIYFLNHTSWWDGIIPVLMNRYLFPQQGLAMMESKQLKRYRFFRWLGAFPVDNVSPEGRFSAVRFTIRHLQKEGTAVYIYPEGKIVPFSTEKPVFQRGIAWLARRLPDVDLVPVGIYIHTRRHARPELHIQVGRPAEPIHQEESEPEVKQRLEQALQSQIQDLADSSGVDNCRFTRWF